MLSERLLTSVVRECTKNYLRLEPTQERRVPGPKPGQKYMLYMLSLIHISSSAARDAPDS